MLHLIWAASVRTRDLLAYAPTNLLLSAIRTRRGLKWGTPAMLLAVPYFLMAHVATTLLATGGPGWLHLVVIWALWNTMKFTVIGPISLALLARAIITEHAAGRLRRRFGRRSAAGR